MPSHNELFPTSRTGSVSIPKPTPPEPKVIKPKKQATKPFQSMFSKSNDDSKSGPIKPQVAQDTPILPKSQSFFRLYI